MQRLNHVALRLLRDIARGLVLHLVEGREGFHPLLLDFDDVPTELGLHWVRDLARVQLERDGREFRHHPVLGEPTEIPAFAGRIFRQFLGDFGEVFAGLDPGEGGFGLFLGRQKDMARVDFRLRRLRLGGGVVGFVFVFVGHRRFGDVSHHRFHGEFVVVIGHAAGDVGRSVLFVGGGLFGHQLQVDEIIDHVFFAGRAVHLRGQGGTDVGQRVIDVLLGDRRAVDLGEHFGIVRMGRRGGEAGAEREPKEQAFLHRTLSPA